ncbi:hotdog fold thioesterase [Luteococcus sp. OSA5]|uniref:hotdog fold thioesterase n=1 Tax=Luteococcus sp. OSA5 TaxID=3401630 RepID=UPI003B438878
MHRSPVAAALGMEVVEADEQRTTLRVVVRDDMLNGFGITHGGMVFTLADETFAIACNTTPDSQMVAQQCEIDYLRPTTVGEVLVATATTIHQGRSASIHDVVVTAHETFDAPGRPIAHFRGRSRTMLPRP